MGATDDEPGPDATVGEFLAATIGDSTRQLILHDPGVRLGEDPEAVHEARVATRRLRSDLRTFEPLLDGEVVDRLRVELAWIGGLLGNVRDPQVLEQRLITQAASLDDMDGSAVSGITDLLLERARFQHVQLLDAMGGDRYRTLVVDLGAVADDPPAASRKVAAKAAAPIAGRLAAEEWKRARRFARRVGDEPDDVALHEVRKRLKRARYAAQSVKRLGAGDKRFRRELAEIQDRLGDHHDLVVQRDFLVAEADRLDARSAFVAGRLVQDIEHRRSAVRDEWPVLVRRLDRLELD